MTTERIDIVVREDGSRIVRRNFEDVAGAADRAGSAVERMKSVLGGMAGILASMGIVASIRQLITYADTWAEVEGRLKLVTNTTAQLTRTQDALFASANRTRQSYADTAGLYATIARATENMNTTDARRLQVVENINKAIIISGTSAASAQAALMQLGQGLASGTLRGEELNSVMEQAPRLAQAIAEGMGRTTGELRKMGEAGKLTAEDVFKAIDSQSKRIEEEFGKMPVTISQSFTVLNNQLLKFVGTSSQANGSAKFLSETILLLGNNLDKLVAVAGGLAAMKISQIIIGWANSVATMISRQAELTALVQAERASLIASAQSRVVNTSTRVAEATATVAQTEAEIAGLTAQRASIIALRENAVAQLASSRATIVQSEAAIAAATAAGAQSYALRILRESTAALAAAEHGRAAAMAEVAALGIAQGRVNAQIATAQGAATAAQAAATAATAAHAAAQTGLAGAMGRTALGAGLLRGALGFLGGPIGIITTLLGVGATAWMLWGNRAKESEEKVSGTFEQTTQDIVADLDKQIEKLRLRNELLRVKPDAGDSESPAALQQERIRQRLIAAQNGSGEFAGMSKEARSGMVLALGQEYGKLAERMSEVAKEQGKVNEAVNGDKLQGWYKKFANNADKLKDTIAQIKKDLGGAEIPKDLMAKIKEHYSDKTENNDGLRAVKVTRDRKIEALEEQYTVERNMQREALTATEELYRQGEVSTFVYQQSQIQALLDGGQKTKALRDRQITELQAYNSKDQTERESTQRQIEKLQNEGNEAMRASFVAAEQLRQKYAYDNTKPQRDDASARTAELVNIDREADALERKAAAYGKLPEQITAAAIAELQAQRATVAIFEGNEAVISQIDSKIAALQRLGAAQAKLNQIEQNSDPSKAEAHLKIMESLHSAAEEAANKMKETFGGVGDAIGSMTTAMSGYARTQAAVAAQLANSIQDAGGDPKKVEAAKALAAKNSAQAQIKSYGDMASAAKGFFKENSTGYKAMEKIEKAYRATEMAMAITAMLQKAGLVEAFTSIFVASKATETAATTASIGPDVAASMIKGKAAAAAGVAAQAQGEPYSAWARMAAMAAAMAALGFAVTGGGRGGGPSAKERQEKAGTGSILGDETAKSKSISRALELAAENSTLSLNYSREMVASLSNIESSLSGLGNLLTRTSGLTGKLAPSEKSAAEKAGNSPWMIGILGGAIGLVTDKLTGGLLGKITGKILGSVLGGKVSTVDTGVMFDAANIGSIANGSLKSQQYTDIKKDGGWFRSDKYSTQTKQLDDEANAQFTKVILDIVSGVKEAGKLLGVGGDEFTAKLEQFTVDIGKISLKDLTGEQIQEQLESIFSKLGDDIAKFAVGGLNDFQQVGEGYLETLVRIASNYATLDAVLASVGGTFGATGLSSIKARERLIELSGGIEKLAENNNTFAEEFLTQAQRLAPVQKYVTDELAKMGLAGLDSRDKFRDHVLGMINSGALLTESGAKDYATLMNLAGAFSQVYAKAKDATKSMQEIADETEELQQRYNEATMTTEQLRAIERKGIAEVNKVLFDNVIAAEKAKEAAEELAAVNERYSEQLDDIRRSVMTATRLREVETAGMDAAAVEVYDRLKSAQAAKATLQKAYAQQKDSFKSILDNLKGFVEKLSTFKNNILLGDLSPLTPQQKYVEAKSQFDKTYAAALGGDKTAQANFTSVAENFLKASQVANASGAKYVEDFNAVQSATNEAIKWATAEVDIAQQQLEALNKQFGGLVAIEESIEFGTKDIVDAIVELAQAIGGKEGAQIIDDKVTPYIEQIYKDVLGRNSDAGGMAYWKDAILKGASMDQVKESFMSSAEYLVSKLYKEVLGRNSDAAGLQYWTQVMGKGTSLEDIRKSFYNSTEYQDAHPQTVAIDYRTMGASNTVSLVAEIQQLRKALALQTEQIEGLREDQNKQTGDLITATYEASKLNADTVSDSTEQAVKEAAYNSNSKVSLK